MMIMNHKLLNQAYSKVNPMAPKVSELVGINISKQRPKDITEDIMRN
jgi:hypothetical protein